MRIAACVTAAAVAALVVTAAARAQSYPVKAVRIVVPVAPGGGTDPQARLLGKKFQESMGQTFVIENRTGAASMIGTEFVVKSPPDGYTLLCAASTLAGAYTLRNDLSFDLLKDLAPVGQISSAAQFLVVHSSVPVSSVKEFIALTKKQTGKMNAASGGNGSANHLTLEMFKQRAGIQATHIAYKGSGPATIALMSGEVDFSFAGALTSLPHIRTGRIKALAVTTSKASPLVPGAPPLMSLYPAPTGMEYSRRRVRPRPLSTRSARKSPARSSFLMCANSWRRKVQTRSAARPRNSPRFSGTKWTATRG